jgi:hypothetical protein
MFREESMWLARAQQLAAEGTAYSSVHFRIEEKPAREIALEQLRSRIVETKEWLKIVAGSNVGEATEAEGLMRLIQAEMDISELGNKHPTSGLNDRRERMEM